jgi:hypothetical protein
MRPMRTGNARRLGHSAQSQDEGGSMNQLSLPIIDGLPFQSLPTPVGMRPRQTCTECGGSFDLESGFARNSISGYTRITRRRICIGCQQEKRDASVVW